VTLDINDMRVALMLFGMVCFFSILVWAFSSRAKKGFDEAALLPFSDDELSVAPSSRQTKEGK
jgi:cytochrome c oxidase cbb3-type subunit 4